jgi:UDP-N-acetylglucosamine 4,6-dehydratase
LNSILITGGTGTIGAALARDALLRGFQRVCIFSRDEYKQAMLRQRMTDERLRWFLGDVRDRDRLRRALEGVDCVIHAAALKRVEAGEFNPGEFVKTNVLGTLNLIEAAHDAGVKRVVGLSTDKALNPQNAYGASKLLMEKLLLAANNARGEHGPMFAVTRFGNVAGSRGSVIDMWRWGGNTLTHPDCTRYWLGEQDALEIVWSALELMPTEPLIPFLHAYRLGDLAEATGIKPMITGLRPGEQMHESLREGESSETAPRMTVEELRALL